MEDSFNWSDWSIIVFIFITFVKMLLPRLPHSEASTLLLAVIHLCILLPTSVRASCKEHVEKYCANMSCRQSLMTLKLNMHEISCRDLRYGYTDECSIDCQNSITALLDSYNGSEGLFLCNCTDTQVFYDQRNCEIDRERLRSCQPLVALYPPKIEDQTPPCIAASQDCESDAGCKSRFDAYLQTCNPEQTDREPECSRDCMGTLEALYSEPLASNFWECSCADQAPNKWCRTSPSEYYELCEEHNMFTSGSPEVPYKPLTTKPTSPSATKVDSSSDTKQQNQNNKEKKPGNTAPSINMNLIYQAALFTMSLLVGVLV